jgi:hypothetical protein
MFFEQTRPAALRQASYLEEVLQPVGEVGLVDESTAGQIESARAACWGFRQKARTNTPWMGVASSTKRQPVESSQHGPSAGHDRKSRKETTVAR